MFKKRQNYYNKKTNQVKLCGFLKSYDIALAVNLKVDYLGCNFFAKSPRYTSLKKALKLLNKINFDYLKRKNGQKTKLVALFVDARFEEIKKVIKTKKFDIIQLHGREKPAFILKLKRYIKSLKSSNFNQLHIWKVFTIKNQTEKQMQFLLKKYDKLCDAFILDIPKQKDYTKGVGEFDSFTLFKNLNQNYNLILAGGLNPENISKILKKSKAKIVDIASGVETRPGYKDFAKVRQILKISKNSVSSDK
jgi:phosphoribosylanthranilate isomerase